METKTPLVTVVVLAYNHLDYTRLCIESLYKYTQDVDFELITINNGSTDGTEEYFNSLPHEKKISFETNIGVDKAINHGFRIAEGKYTLNLSNDIVVTTHWLKNLVTCAESDPSIAMVVPACSYSSNFQQVDLGYKTLEEMQVLAAAYNQSNPGLWEEKMRLVTYTCLFRTELQKAIGGFDEDFNPGAYDDDAIGFTFRRRGMKLILAKDTFVHHYGSVTFNAEYAKNNLPVRNRDLFYRKFGVHSWPVGFIDFNVVGLAEYAACGSEPVKLLGAGGTCGASLLQIKNGYRRMGQYHVELNYLADNPLNLPDLASVCKKSLFGLPDEVETFFSEEDFDVVVLESETDKVAELEETCHRLGRRLKEGGRLITTALPQTYPVIEKALLEDGFIKTGNINSYYFAFNKLNKEQARSLH